MKGASVVQTQTILGGMDLSELLTQLYLATNEIVERAELTPNMLTEYEVVSIVNASTTSLMLLDKLGGEADDNSDSGDT
jgi:hypothetical protein